MSLDDIDQMISVAFDSTRDDLKYSILKQKVMTTKILLLRHSPTTELFRLAFNSIAIFTLLLQYGTPRPDVMYLAIKNAQDNIVELLIKQCRVTTDMLIVAIEQEKVSIVELLSRHYQGSFVELFNVAAQVGNMQTIEILLQNKQEGAINFNTAIEYATSFGFHEITQRLILET